MCVIFFSVVKLASLFQLLTGDWIASKSASVCLFAYASVVGSFHHCILGVFRRQRVGSSRCHPPLLPAMSFAL